MSTRCLRVGVIALSLGLFLTAQSASATTLPLGFLIVELDPESDNPGDIAFSINNFTGGFAGAPDFPVIDDVNFLTWTLTLNDGSGAQTISSDDLGLIPSGPFLDTGGTRFSALTFSAGQFVSASFTATLDRSQLHTDAGLFELNASSFAVDLEPVSGEEFLQPGDLAVFAVEGELVASEVPEPATITTLLIGTAALLRRSRARPGPRID